VVVGVIKNLHTLVGKQNSSLSYSKTLIKKMLFKADKIIGKLLTPTKTPTSINTINVMFTS